MNNTHISSKTNELKGKAKEEIGHLTGNGSMESEGVAEQVKSKIQGAVADAKDGIKKVVDNLLKKNTH